MIEDHILGALSNVVMVFMKAMNVWKTGREIAGVQTCVSLPGKPVLWDSSAYRYAMRAIT